MKKILCFCLLAFLGLQLAQAQSKNSPIEKVGKSYEQNGDILTPIELGELLKTQPQSAEYLRQAQTTSTVGTVVAGIGGGLVGYPVGTAIGGGEPQWILAAVGAGVIVLAIPIVKAANKKVDMAVDAYNTGLGTSRNFNRRGTSLQFGGTPNGVGLIFGF